MISPALLARIHLLLTRLAAGCYNTEVILDFMEVRSEVRAAVAATPSQDILRAAALERLAEAVDGISFVPVPSSVTHPAWEKVRRALVALDATPKQEPTNTPVPMQLEQQIVDLKAAISLRDAVLHEIRKVWLTAPAAPIVQQIDAVLALAPTQAAAMVAALVRVAKEAEIWVERYFDEEPPSLENALANLRALRRTQQAEDKKT